MVAARGNNLDGTAVHIDDGNVECAATEVIYEDRLALCGLHAVRDGCSSRLIDDAEDIESGYLACLLGLHTLFCSEISGTCYHYVSDGFGIVAKVIGVLHKLLKDKSRNLCRVHVVRKLVGRLVEISVHTHRALHEAHAVLRLGREHSLCLIADYGLFLILKVYHRGSGGSAVKVGKHNCLVKLVHLCYTAICCSEVDAINGT